MNKFTTKDMMLFTASLLLLASFVFVIWYMFQPIWYKNIKAEVTNQPYARTISVSGEGEVTSKPDMAVVNLSVVSQGGSVKAVTEDGNQKMGQVIAAVKNLGVSDDDVKTTSYDLRPEYRYPENQKAQIAGYTLSQNLMVKVRDLSKVEDVVDKGVSAGSNQVGQLSFEIDDDSKQRDEAREEAFGKAREKAEAMAKAAGVKLGRVVTFYESNDLYSPSPVYYERSAVAMDMAVAPSIEAGSQETKVTVNVTYEIE